MNTLPRHSNRYFNDYQATLQAIHVERWMQQVLDQIHLAQSLSDWEQAIYLWNEIKCHIETHAASVSLAFYRNTQDEKTQAEEKRFNEEIEPPYKTFNAKIREKILSSPVRAALEENLGQQYFVWLQIQQDAFHPQNVETETEIHLLLSEYTKLTGNAEFEIAGKTYPLAHYKKFSSSPDPALRRESLQKYSQWFLNHREKLEDIFEQCVQKRSQMAQAIGHSSYTPLGYQKMGRVDYGPDEVAEFRKQIKEAVVPIATQIRAQQAKKIGTSTLAVWDGDFFPQWKVDRLKVEISGQVGAGLRVYQSLSSVLAGHFQKMIDYDLMDVPARHGKAPGAFCTEFSDARMPFIFLNSVNEVSDITTLLHECGHAFQGWESRTIDLLELRGPTLEACEVHSMGMEFLAHPYYEEFLSPENAAKFRKYHLAESLLLLPYIAVVDEFQHRIYTGEAKGPEGRARVWEELEKQYLPALDYQDLAIWRKYRWLRQLHIFHNPFYYIDYGIALVGALQLWVRSIQDKQAALRDYLHLCQLGGTLPLREFFKAGNLKLPFEKGVLDELLKAVLQSEPILD